MRKYPFFIVLSVCLFSALLVSCERRVDDEKIQLPPTPVLSIRSDWGVVRSSFLRIREDPLLKARILAHLRKGSILEIISRTEEKEILEDAKSYWYQVSYQGLRGWVFGAYLEILDSKTRAQIFANGLE